MFCLNRTKRVAMKEICLDSCVKELHLSLVFNGQEDALKKVSDALNEFSKCGASVISAEVYAPKGYSQLIELLEVAPYPYNWICPLDEESEPKLEGLHFTAIAGCNVQYFKSENSSKAVVYEDSQNIYCKTFGVFANADNDDGYLHTHSNLNELEAVLRMCGFEYTDIARTWFYNDDILAWYAPFNKARTEFYQKRGIFDGLLPASTGIGAPNLKGKKITSGALAIKSKLGKTAGSEGFVVELPSPLQGGATEYGSSFSRAVEITSERSQRIMISGTASIAPDGKTIYLDDIQKQVQLTMDVIGGILKSRGLDFENTTSSVVYCRKPEYFAEFEKWNKQNNITFCPAYSIVCRDDLLFEVELEAAKNL